MSERRIEVHTRYGEDGDAGLDEQDLLDSVVVDGLCNKCEDDHEVSFETGFQWTDAVPGLNWSGIFKQAEIMGLDLTRRFSMEMHLAQEYVEFWQEPTMTPNEMTP